MNFKKSVLSVLGAVAIGMLMNPASASRWGDVPAPDLSDMRMSVLTTSHKFEPRNNPWTQTNTAADRTYMGRQDAEDFANSNLRRYEIDDSSYCQVRTSDPYSDGSHPSFAQMYTYDLRNGESDILERTFYGSARSREDQCNGWMKNLSQGINPNEESISYSWRNNNPNDKYHDIVRVHYKYNQ